MDLSLPIRAASTAARRGAARPQCLRQAARASAIRCLHNSASRTATPFPQAEIPSPPPPPPVPATSTTEDRLSRKRQQAELLKKGREAKANPAKPASALKKRFWQHASVKEVPEGLQIHLDTRPVRTADKSILTIPKNKHQLAMAIAFEWDMLVSSQQALKQHYIPMTALVSRALDIQNADAAGDSRVRDSIITMLMRYLHTDTLLCWAPERDLYQSQTGLGRDDSQGRNLRQLQMETATPIISYLTNEVWPGVEINPILDPDSIMPVEQPAMTQQVIKGWITGLKPFELAGLERAVLASKSLLVAARLVVEWSQEFAHLREKDGEQRFGVQDAAHACSLEVNWQTGMWGEVEDTHDVEREDMRRQLGSTVLLVSGQTS